MITDDQSLDQTRQALAHMENALKALTRDILPKNPARFALMAEPVVEYIRDLRREIEDYIGYTFAVSQQAEPDIARMLEEWSAKRGATIGVARAEGFRQHKGYGYPQGDLLREELGIISHKLDKSSLP